VDPVMNAEQLAYIEAQIGELLGAGGYQNYQILKDSDAEQHHLREYATSVSAKSPIDQAQERSLLFTKLRHKQLFHLALRTAGFYQPRVSGENRENLRRLIPRALEEYKNNYLREVRPVLSDEQYRALEKYENTEFNWELERQLKQLDARTK
jgi:hypothetical protein